MIMETLVIAGLIMQIVGSLVIIVFAPMAIYEMVRRK